MRNVLSQFSVVASGKTLPTRTQLLSTTMRHFSSTTNIAELAERLSSAFPKEDPRVLRDGKLQQLIQKVSSKDSGDTPKSIAIPELRAVWQKLFDEKMQEIGEESLGDPAGLTHMLEEDDDGGGGHHRPPQI